MNRHPAYILELKRMVNFYANLEYIGYPESGDVVVALNQAINAIEKYSKEVRV